MRALTHEGATPAPGQDSKRPEDAMLLTRGNWLRQVQATLHGGPFGQVIVAGAWSVVTMAMVLVW